MMFISVISATGAVCSRTPNHISLPWSAMAGFLFGRRLLQSEILREACQRTWATPEQIKARGAET